MIAHYCPLAEFVAVHAIERVVLRSFVSLLIILFNPPVVKLLVKGWSDIHIELSKIVVGFAFGTKPSSITKVANAVVLLHGNVSAATGTGRIM